MFDRVLEGKYKIGILVSISHFKQSSYPIPALQLFTETRQQRLLM